MEAVGVVIPVRHPGDDAVLLAVHPDEPARKALRRGGQQGEVQPGLLALLVHPGTHPGDNLQTQPLAPFALTVVLACESHQGFRQTDKAHREGAVLEHLPDLVGPGQLFAVQPDPLAHKEGEIIDVLAGLDFKAFPELVDAQIQFPVQLVKKGV